jgi:hypothetical protein
MATGRFAALGDSSASVRVQYVFTTCLSRYAKWSDDDETDDVINLHPPLRALHWLKACLLERDGRAVADALAPHALDACCLLRVALFARTLLPSLIRACSVSTTTASAFVSPTCFTRVVRSVACHVTTLKPSPFQRSILVHGLRLVALQLLQRRSIVVRLQDELKTNAAALTMAALAQSSEFDEQELPALWTDAADVWVHRATRATAAVMHQQWLAFLGCLSLPLMRTSALVFRTWCILVMKLGRCITDLSAAAVPLRAALELWHTCHARHEHMGAHHVLGLAVWLVRVERPRFVEILAPVDAPPLLALAAAMRAGAFAPDVAHIVSTWLVQPNAEPDAEAGTETAPEPAPSAATAAAARQLCAQLQLYLVAGGVRPERALQRCQDAVRVLSALGGVHGGGGGGGSVPGAGPEMLRCMLCCAAPVNCVFLPCGHLAACLTCAARLLGAVMRCPVCRGESEAKPVFVP